MREAGVADGGAWAASRCCWTWRRATARPRGLDVANTYLRVTLLDMGLRLVDSRVWRYEALTEEVLEQALRHGAAPAEAHAGRGAGGGPAGRGLWIRPLLHLPIRT